MDTHPIRARLAELQMSQQELCRRLKDAKHPISATFLSEIIRYRKSCRWSMAVKIGHVLGILPAKIMECNPEPKQRSPAAPAAVPPPPEGA